MCILVAIKFLVEDKNGKVRGLNVGWTSIPNLSFLFFFFMLCIKDS